MGLFKGLETTTGKQADNVFKYGQRGSKYDKS